MTIGGRSARRSVSHQVLFALALVASSVALPVASAAASTPAQGAARAPSYELRPPPKTLKHPKLDSHLAEVSAATAAGGVAEGLRVARKGKLIVSGETVRVLVRGDRSAARVAIRAAGGGVEAEYADLIQAVVPLGALTTLANFPGVIYVDAPSIPVAEAVTDEGIALTNANLWQAAGWTGGGVKVGIIDLGFAGYATAQAAGDLPTVVTTQDYCGGTMGAPESHGTAVAEIVHKMAPAAQLLFS